MHQNHLGSPLATTDAAGQQLWRESYTPPCRAFSAYIRSTGSNISVSPNRLQSGEKWRADGDNDDNVSFTGHIHDTMMNLILCILLLS